MRAQRATLVGWAPVPPRAFACRLPIASPRASPTHPSPPHALEGDSPVARAPRGDDVMSFWQFLNHWWNLPYLVMLGLVGVFFALQIVGFATHDGDADADHDIDHDVDHDADHDAEADHEGPLEGVFAFLGIGRVPF